MLATITSKGQVTLPISIRTALKLDVGSRLDFTLQNDGSIRVVPIVRNPLALCTILPKPTKQIRRMVNEKNIRSDIIRSVNQRFNRSVS